jgi:hypothetical protein
MYALLSMDIYNTSHNSVFSDFNVPFQINMFQNNGSYNIALHQVHKKTNDFFYSHGPGFEDKLLYFMSLNAGKGAQIF